MRSVIFYRWDWMGSWRRHNNQKARLHSQLITYEDSFLYPMDSTHKIRISLKGLFLLVPNPTASPLPKNFDIKMVRLIDRVS